MEMSITATSGFVVRIMSNAANPVTASPTTSMSGVACNRDFTPASTTGWSSASARRSRFMPGRLVGVG